MHHPSISYTCPSATYGSETGRASALWPPSHWGVGAGGVRPPPAMATPLPLSLAELGARGRRREEPPLHRTTGAWTGVDQGDTAGFLYKPRRWEAVEEKWKGNLMVLYQLGLGGGRDGLWEEQQGITTTLLKSITFSSTREHWALSLQCLISMEGGVRDSLSSINQMGHRELV